MSVGGGCGGERRLRDDTPVLVGVGRLTQRSGDPGSALDPVSLQAEAARMAAADAAGSGASTAPQLLAKVGAIAAAQMLLEPRVPSRLRPLYCNPARSVAALAGATGANRFFLTTTGGQSPQLAVNELCERVARGDLESVVLVGGECLASFERARKSGWRLPGEQAGAGKRGAAPTLEWGDLEATGGPEPERLGYSLEWPLATLTGVVHGIHVPTTIYALIEQAIRKRLGRTDAEHTAAIARLFSGFSEVAARNPRHAWFPRKRSPAELATVTKENRSVTRPGYPKMLNAIMDVDQAAAVLLCSVGWARRHGVPESQWVFLHGCGDAYELPPLMRARLDRSPAMREACRQAREMAAAAGGGLTSLDGVRHWDVYSCFPSAVEVALQEMGIPETDGARLTLTGGLPYYGGAGNSYAMHGIVAMVEALRRHRGEFGMVTANGGWLSEHSCGLYSTAPVAGRWARADSAPLQAELNRASTAAGFAECEEPEGRCSLDVYTVEHTTTGPSRLVVIGRLTSGPDAGARFAAVNTEPRVIDFMLAADRNLAGCTGTVKMESVAVGTRRLQMAVFTPDEAGAHL